MKIKRWLAGLCLVSLIWISIAGDAASKEVVYSVTPAKIEIAAVQAKLKSLGYLEDTTLGSGDKAVSETETALWRFREEQAIDVKEPAASPMSARTLVRLMAQQVPVMQLVFVPVYGGKKYHSRADCSKMIDPEGVDIATAELLGFDPCRKCYK